MSDNVTIVKVLDRAAEFASDGWMQGATRRVNDGKTCVCMFGAIVFASDMDQPIYGNASDIVTEYVRELCGDKRTNLVKYNDTPGRTQQEVVDTLRAVARKLEAEA